MNQTSEIVYEAPIPSRATKNAISLFAEEQRVNAKISNGFELADLIRHNGGKIEYIGVMDSDQTDAIIVDPDDTFLIRLSSHTGARRDNFTLAHELAHKLLHWPLVKASFANCGMKATRRVDKTNDDLVRCEWEANWFASAFLMPEEHFRAIYSSGTASEIFGVTQAAVNVRAKTLGLLA